MVHRSCQARFHYFPKYHYERKTPEDQVFFGVRAEEVMIIKDNRPIPKAIQDENVLSVILRRVVEKGSSHTMEFEEATHHFFIIAEIPNYVYRKLNYTIGQEMKIFMRKRDICIMES